jgi:hypothetical protein
MAGLHTSIFVAAEQTQDDDFSNVAAVDVVRV